MLYKYSETHIIFINRDIYKSILINIIWWQLEINIAHDCVLHAYVDSNNSYLLQYFYFFLNTFY